MSRQRSRNTTPELELRRVLHRRGLRYRLHERLLDDRRRSVDIVFRRAKVAVFVDGCYWHGCQQHGSWPKSNTEWWRRKIERNRTRDRDTDERLREAGWTVIRVWEHDDPDAAADRVEAAVERS